MERKDDPPEAYSPGTMIGLRHMHGDDVAKYTLPCLPV